MQPNSSSYLLNEQGQPMYISEYQRGLSLGLERGGLRLEDNMQGENHNSTGTYQSGYHYGIQQGLRDAKKVIRGNKEQTKDF